MKIVGPLSFAELFSFIHKKGFWTWTACLRLNHNISIGFNSRLEFPEPLRGGLAGVFGIEVTNWWPDVRQDFFLYTVKLMFEQSAKSVSVVQRRHSYHGKPFRSAIQQQQNMLTHELLVWCCFCRILLFFTRCNRMNPFPKILHLLCHSREYFAKVLGIIKTFIGRCETTICVLFGEQWFCSSSSNSLWRHYPASNFMNGVRIDLNWGS